MKTAMQELIDELDLIKIVEKHNFFMVKYIIEQCLEKEKEQIINAHTNAYLIGEDNISVEDANKASEQYYNQTYKPETI
jgi:hypothetical protein